MGFVKLDTALLDSTLWDDRVAREVFITALLMALPFEVKDSIPALGVRTFAKSGFTVPPGWYGIVQSAGVGIVRRSLVGPEEGMDALERLGSPDPESRSTAYEGRRLVRVSGGYLVLNFIVYRDRDYTTAVRSKRYRNKKIDAALSDGSPPSHPDAVSSRRDAAPSRRDATHAEEEAEAEAEARAKAVTPDIADTQRPNRRTRAAPDMQFEEAWLLYPKRAGSNIKSEALSAWHARLAQGISPEALHAGVLRYAEFCRVTGKLGTEYVMQAVRFFGPSSQWEESWSTPVIKSSRSKQESGIQNLTNALNRRAEGAANDGE